MHFAGQPSAEDRRSAVAVYTERTRRFPPDSALITSRIKPRAGETWWNFRARMARVEVAQAHWKSVVGRQSVGPPPDWEVEANLAKWDSPAWADAAAVKKMRQGIPPETSLLPQMTAGQRAPAVGGLAVEAPSFFEPTAAMLMHERMMQWQATFDAIPIPEEVTIEQLVERAVAAQPSLANGQMTLPLVPLPVVVLAAATLIRAGGRAALRQGVIWVQKNEKKIKLANDILDGHLSASR